MIKILIHHPWVQFYLLVVGTMLIAVLLDCLSHPQPSRRKYRPPEAGSTSLPVRAKPPPTAEERFLCEAPRPADSQKKQLAQCQDWLAERIRE
jgi:hypothetical protein